METLHDEHVKEFIREVGRCSYIAILRLEKFFPDRRRGANNYSNTSWLLINNYYPQYSEGYQQIKKEMELLRIIKGEEKFNLWTNTKNT